jgi:hypothetical protein
VRVDTLVVSSSDLIDRVMTDGDGGCSCCSSWCIRRGESCDPNERVVCNCRV